ncbi:MAG: HEAT repeat domain-containing protein [Planctomycetales bacterium]
MQREFHRLSWGLTLVVGMAGLAGSPGRLTAQNAPVPPEPADESFEPERQLGNSSPLVGTPRTPRELLEATLLMVELGRQDLAERYFGKLVSQELDDQTLLELRDEFGAAPFLRLTRVEVLKEDAEKLLDRTNALAAQRVTDAAYALRLLQELDAGPERRAAAQSELNAAGVLIVPSLLAILSDPDQSAQHERVVTAIVGVGEEAVPPLLGALDGPDDFVRTRVIAALGRIGSDRAAAYLWAPSVSPVESATVHATARQALARILRIPEAGVERVAGTGMAARLVKQARAYYRQEPAFTATTDPDQMEVVWSWDDARRTVVPGQYSAAEARDIHALMLARQALALAPETRPVQTLFLGLALTAEVRRGIDKPLATGPGSAHDLALSAGGGIVNDVLAEALAASRPATCAAALKILEQIGTKEQLAGGSGGKSPVLRALDYPDQRVQFAAATAILQIDPPAGFRGAPRVVEVLQRAAAADTRPHAVVGEVSSQRAAQIGGFLRELGYEPLVFLSGREAFRAAATRGDVELVVLHPNLIRWALSETLANLRADSRTAGIPIVIHSPADLRMRMQSYSGRYQLVSAVSLATTPEDFELQVQPILKRLPVPPMTPAQRSTLRKDAVWWLAHIASGRRTRVFDISPAEQELTEALSDPQLAAHALDALGEIASRRVQQQMAQIVLNPQGNAELRRAAALRVAFHIQRFGLLLDRETIDSLHQAWNDNQQTAEIRTALGSVIGSLKPDAALVGKRLQGSAAAQ